MGLDHTSTKVCRKVVIAQLNLVEKFFVDFFSKSYNIQITSRGITLH